MRNFLKISGITLLFFSVLSSAFFTSCVTVDTRKITYFQSADTLPYQVLPPITPHVTRIQPDDILAVTVSSLSEESNVVFNFPNINALNTTVYPAAMGGGQMGRQPLGYLVDSTGTIEMPLVGKVKVTNMSLAQASDTIKVRLLNYLKEPTVNVRYLNHKFTVIGEVNRPSVINLLDDHTSLPEALGMAGDLTIYGLRKNVMLIRTEKDKREVVRIDLTSRDFFNSPYYYLRNNDVIYVDVNKGKVTFTDQRVQQLQLIPIFTGIATTIVVILNLLK
ncbi:polysaccharide biosynthesis/export family protein [Runella slithyformis]|uniref:Polysaccharide export protein n=1 Tax=Runella slithyformis (strain ATCC 29530 / DSM 19594 / LMG 11500 / NCIMB 11436 / LSU 4) TaxID=761193 RepID=A0A7U3ZPK8_RUNSL|nr:polysaccharide biosynthesis/export family protein [Runella slithyformis]AEI51022.1 polysaccharide export protein [Runella slithyformis DSM 19594]